MRLPSKEEKKLMLKSFRKRYIHMVNPNKNEWEQLTYFEKHKVDKLCEQHYSTLQF